MPAALARSFDTRTLTIVSSLVGRSPRADLVAGFVAEHLAKLHVLLLIALLLGGRGPAGWRRRETAVRIAVALPLTIAAVGAVGRLVRRDRPFAGRTGVTSLVAHDPDRSFPSRHSACAAAMATVALPTAPRVGLMMALAGLALAASRVYAGLHYPTDVVGGWMIGVVVGVLVRRKEHNRARWI